MSDQRRLVSDTERLDALKSWVRDLNRTVAALGDARFLHEVRITPAHPVS